MKITAIDPILIDIPFEDGGTGLGLTPLRWNSLEMVLVRVTTDTGLVGWGEAFGYFCQRSVAAVITDLIAPCLIGRDPSDPAALNDELQRRLVLFGRYGITIFGISGVDIALWDLKAKAEGVSLAHLLNDGRRRREHVVPYASLVRYGQADLVARFSEQAAREAYPMIKLHETTMPEIRAGRGAIDPSVQFTIDVNCSWTEAHAAHVLPELKALDTLWLEEPIFPPEDWEAMRRLGEHGVAISAGENACTSIEFGRLAKAVTYPQPSVTKVGGVTEFVRIAAIAVREKRTLMAHTPYFGPGYFATLQLAAAVEPFGLFEYLWVRPQAWAAIDQPLPEGGLMPIPDRPGIGFEPDLAVLERFKVS
jgi:L-alanine-DL-glutamate epimerase-like enolase superfamily enzyme